MPYFRESHYTEKLLVGFTPDQRSALDKVSAQKGRSLAGVVRNAVDLHLQTEESKSEGCAMWRWIERAREGRTVQVLMERTKKRSPAATLATLKNDAPM